MGACYENACENRFPGTRNSRLRPWHKNIQEERKLVRDEDREEMDNQYVKFYLGLC